MEVTCFSDHLLSSSPQQEEESQLFHFQIIKLHKQIYAWIGCCCNSPNLGSLFAATSPKQKQNNNNRVVVSVANILGGGGGSDNPGPSIARRIVLRTGFNVLLACNIPNNNPMLQAAAEKKLLQKLITLGYTHPSSSSS